MFYELSVEKHLHAENSHKHVLSELESQRTFMKYVYGRHIIAHRQIIFKTYTRRHSANISLEGFFFIGRRLLKFPCYAKSALTAKLLFDI